MVDKRESRRRNAASFVRAIEGYRSEHTLSTLARPPTRADTAAFVSGWVRARPMLPPESERGEFDSLSVTADGVATSHCCLMKPDLHRMFIRHSTFRPSGGAFGPEAGSRQLGLQASVHQSKRLRICLPRCT